MKSVVNSIRGLPFDPDTKKRVYLFSAWTRDAIMHAREKVRKFDRQHVKIQRHLGMSGDHGPEWWSFTACLYLQSVVVNRFERMPSRYGFDRWTWTRATEILAD